MKTNLRATECHLPYGITLLLATRHRWTCPTLTPARQANKRFAYSTGIKSQPDLGGWLYTEMVQLMAYSYPFK